MESVAVVVRARKHASPAPPDQAVPRPLPLVLADENDVAICTWLSWPAGVALVALVLAAAVPLVQP